MDVSAAINRILVNTCKVDKQKLVNQSVEFTQLELDSLSILEAIYEIEVEFDIELDDVQLSELRAVSDLVAAVAAQLHKAA